MVHAIFEFIRTLKSHVDGVAKHTVPEQPEAFSSVFEILFPSTPFEEEDPVTSWLDAIASGFKFNDSYVPEPLFIRALALFHESGLISEQNEEQPSPFQFFLYLFWIFWKNKNKPLQKYNIFKFFTGFKIADTRLVLLGQDPIREPSATGFAFHGARCHSSEFILEKMKNESQIYQDFQMSGQNPMEFSEEEFIEACNTCSMEGWIEQKVLMLNVGLTYCPDWQMRLAWKIFTDFLVKYLNDMRSLLVFIFVGREAAKKKDLVSKEKHLTLIVLHPAIYSFNVERNPLNTYLDWDRVLPFMSANLFLYQKCSEAGNGENSLIDWNSVGGEIPGRQERLEYMTNCFRRLIVRSSLLKIQSGCFVKMGRLLLFKNEDGTVIVKNGA